MIRLFVGNIPHAASEIELRRHFENASFTVTAAQVIRDRMTGHSRGFGFVELQAEPSHMRTICDSMNGTRMSGRVLTVNEATARTPKGVR